VAARAAHASRSATPAWPPQPTPLERSSLAVAAASGRRTPRASSSCHEPPSRKAPSLKPPPRYADRHETERLVQPHARDTALHTHPPTTSPARSQISHGVSGNLASRRPRICPAEDASGLKADRRRHRQSACRCGDSFGVPRLSQAQAGQGGAREICWTRVGSPRAYPSGPSRTTVAFRMKQSLRPSPCRHRPTLDRWLRRQDPPRRRLVRDTYDVRRGDSITFSSVALPAVCSHARIANSGSNRWRRAHAGTGRRSTVRWPRRQDPHRRRLVRDTYYERRTRTTNENDERVATRSLSRVWLPGGVLACSHRERAVGLTFTSRVLHHGLSLGCARSQLDSG
jgi:hypothetical protein